MDDSYLVTDPTPLQDHCQDPPYSPCLVGKILSANVHYCANLSHFSVDRALLPANAARYWTLHLLTDRLCIELCIDI